jgi:hypothetical protein
MALWSKNSSCPLPYDLIERTRLNERSSALIERLQARAREKIRKEHELAKAAVREQQEKIQAHHAAISELMRQLNDANAERGQAFAARDAAQEEKRRLSRYADKRQIERASELLAKRESEADHAAKELILRSHWLPREGP